MFAKTETISSSIDKASKILSCISPTARLDSEILLSFILKKEKSWLITHREYLLNAAEAEAYKKVILRRKDHEPIAYITNKKEFMGLDFYVDRSVLIPRPETEILVEKALDIIKSGNIQSVLEIGTGSGIISCSTAYYSSQKLSIEALDISGSALAVAKKNAFSLGLTKSINFSEIDIFDFEPKKKYDLILTNPPYVKDSEIIDELSYEPFNALSGGKNGLNFITLLLPKLSLLTDNICLMEIGEGQDKYLKHNQFFETEFIEDLAGINRVAMLTNVTY
ncbi:MAG: peptide chain release factor N(5)-glutamine methyltransferase [Epsilonproteobacteria bacterium]|nr:peptide chain release factor N(5)-glutamine methyltransferase [Campylobacterota bacterium]